MFARSVRHIMFNLVKGNDGEYLCIQWVCRGMQGKSMGLQWDYHRVFSRSVRHIMFSLITGYNGECLGMQPVWVFGEYLVALGVQIKFCSFLDYICNGYVLAMHHKVCRNEY